MRRSLFPAVLACLALLVTAAAGILADTDRAAYDAFSLFWMGAVKPDSAALPVIVAIDASSLSEYGRWPWPRSTLAELLRRLAEDPPAAVGIDLLLADSTSDDEDLAGAIGALPVVLAERLDLRRAGAAILAGRPEPPTPVLARAAHASGFTDFFPDGDGVARKMLYRFSETGTEHLSFAAAIARVAGRMSFPSADEFAWT